MTFRRSIALLALALATGATVAPAVPSVCPTLASLVDGTYAKFVQDTLREDLGPGAFEALGEGFGGSVYRYTPADRGRNPVVVKIYTEASALQKDYAALTSLRSALDRHPISGVRVAAAELGRLPHTMELENIYGNDLKEMIAKAEQGSAQQSALVAREAEFIYSLKAMLNQEYVDVTIIEATPSRLKATAVDRFTRAVVKFWFKADNVLVDAAVASNSGLVIIDPY